MPRRLPPPPEIIQFWTTGEIDVAIRRLERRIRDIEALQADGVRHRDLHLRNVEQSVRDTILEIFGIASQQFYRHEHFKIDNGPSIKGSHVDDLGAVNELRQAQFVEQIPGAIARIRELIDSLGEQREALAEPKAAPVQPSRGAPVTRRLRGPQVTSAVATTTRRPSSRREGPWSRS